MLGIRHASIAKSRRCCARFLSCALMATLLELLCWSEPAGMPLWGLSGHVRPGGDTGSLQSLSKVTEHTIHKTMQHGKLVIDINLNYPSLGNTPVDVDIQRWATGIVEAFVENLTDDAPAGDASQAVQSFALHGSYTVSHPSEAVASLTFELWTYTGGAHGNLDIITLNYSLLNGQRLDLIDLFEDADEALKLMSDWSFQVLSLRFAGAWVTQMLKDGTSPDVQNFSSLTLTPEGIIIHFQPYQVAPWAVGAQEVEMSFEKLLPADPLPTIWGKPPKL